MTVDVEGFDPFKAEYYAVSTSSICDHHSASNMSTAELSFDTVSNGTDCSSLERVHANGVRFFFASIGGLIWSLLFLCTVSLHGATRRLRKWTVSKLAASCLLFGFIPEILIIMFQIWFSDKDAFCGMDTVFDAVIEDHLEEGHLGEDHFTDVVEVDLGEGLFAVDNVANTINLVDGVYFDCDYKNSNIASFPITWIPGCIMVLLLMLLCLYKPLSPMVRRILNACSCCVNRKVSDSIIPVARYFSFSGTADAQSAAKKRIIAHKRRGSTSLNRN